MLFLLLKTRQCWTGISIDHTVKEHPTDNYAQSDFPSQSNFRFLIRFFLLHLFFYFWCSKTKCDTQESRQLLLIGQCSFSFRWVRRSSSNENDKKREHSPRVWNRKSVLHVILVYQATNNCINWQYIGCTLMMVHHAILWIEMIKNKLLSIYTFKVFLDFSFAPCSMRIVVLERLHVKD